MFVIRSSSLTLDGVTADAVTLKADQRRVLQMAMWRYEATVRIGKGGQLAIDGRSCPDECGGFLGRLAERQYKRPYTWIPIGWRCNKCGYVIIDTKVNV